MCSSNLLAFAEGKQVEVCFSTVRYDIDQWLPPKNPVARMMRVIVVFTL